MSSRYKKQLMKLEVQMKNIKQVVERLMIRESGYLASAMKNKEKEKQLSNCIDKLHHELEQLKPIKAGKSNSFTPDSIRYLEETRGCLWDEHDLVKKQNQDLDLACRNQNTNDIQEQLRQIKGGESGGSSSDNLTQAIKNLNMVQEGIKNELDRLMESLDKNRCFPYCW